MSSHLSTKSRIARRILSSGYQVTPDALDRLTALGEELAAELVKWLSSRAVRGSVVDASVIERFLGERSQRSIPHEEEAVAGHDGVATEELNLTVLKPTYEEIRMEGKAEEFTVYRVTRFGALWRITSQRGLPLRSLREILESGDEGYAVCEVREVSKGDGYYRLRLEDPNGIWTAVASARDRSLSEKVEGLCSDMVVAVRVAAKGGRLVVKDVMLPDLPQSERPFKGPDVRVCVISDVHVGSSRFNRRAFEDFLSWLSSEHEDLNVRLLLINGDLVDGVFVYPGQREELEIRTLRDQFAEAGRLLARVPRRVEIAYVPGNHEPVRRALPQPPVHADHRRLLDPEGRILFLGNPALIEVGGARVLLFHGQTMDDVIQSSMRFSYSDLRRTAGEVMEVLLRSRHLAPSMEVTPVIPWREDHLLLEEVPHVLATGHIHVAAFRVYRGARLVNSGTFQDQTKLQKGVGLEPTVGTVAVLDLRDLSVRFERFA
ncbi:MAG: metallophosphoesterase [Nitrososphaerota archaeon]|nr:metallophosphoesterase [Candidatus Calditenuis fumarioli]